MSRQFQSRYALCFALLLAAPVSAQFQRMGLAPGFVSLAPHGSSSVRTYCLDYTREAPHRGISYTNLLSNPEQITVTVDGRRMNGQQAIDSKIVAWEGTTPRVADIIERLNDPLVLARLPEAERQRAGAMVAIWRQLTPTDRRHLETELEPLIGSHGDYTRLHLVNLTDKKVDISIGGKVVLGTEPESLSGLKVASIGQIDDDSGQRDQQSKAWLASNMESQQLLKNLGFYAGSIDGIAGPHMKDAIRKFQENNGLQITGVLDAGTNERLRGVAADRALAVINGQTPGTLVATIANSPSDIDARYKVYTGSGRPIYAGNSPGKLADALNAELQRPGVDTVYLDLEGFGLDKAEALASSLRIRNPDVAVRSVTTSEDGLPARDLLFSRGVKLESRDPRVEEIKAGERKGWFASKLDFSVRVRSAVKRVSLRILAKSKELVGEFASALLGRDRTGGFDENATLGEWVRAARHDLKAKHPELKDEDLRVEMKDQFGETLIVELRLMTTDALAA